MPLNVALQLPRWARTIYQEKRATAQLVQQLSIGRIISDSRFGCYHPGIPSVMMTHQLHPITNSKPVSWLYRNYLKRCFTEFWVPDFPDQRMSGKLSNSDGYSEVRMIGPLSRLKPAKTLAAKVKSFTLLSGPEPMRSRLEAIILGQLKDIPGQHILVRGIPSAKEPEVHNNITIYDFADADFLAAHLPAADWIICRSGYSTLMDLAALEVPGKVLLVPTPGQTEQVFLARALVQSGDAEAMVDQGQVVLVGLIG